MNKSTERPLSLACVSDQSADAAALYEALMSVFPGASIQRVDTDVEMMLPDAVDCAVIDAVVNGTEGVDVLRRLRARGYDGAAVLIVDPRRSPADRPAAERLGAHPCELNGGSVAPLASAVTDALKVSQGDAGPGSAAAVRALRQTQKLLAAGELAMRLQHSLNNPLAALLAEAQLLELETLPPDHRESVERIIELSRRVISVVRGLDGVGRA